MQRDKYYMIDRLLLNKGISLEEIGCNEIAWDFEHVLFVVEHLADQGYYILGGDILHYSKGEIVHTYDSWFYDIEKENVNDKTIRESKMTALHYIQMYHKRNGNDYLYCPVFVHKERILYK